MIYSCCDSLRRTAVLQASGWNGIDYLEVIDAEAPTFADRQRFLTVHFVKPPDLLILTPQNIRIEGGERIVDIRVLTVETGSGDEAHVVTLEVDRPGDFSLYTLRLVRDALSEMPPAGVDPQLAAVQFSFKVECSSPFDCAPADVCPADSPSIPPIDYLAKDYASFRRLMLDRMAALLPGWTERNAADPGIALIEALAYSADQLSYMQDAIATEAYLGTARRRISVRRHARLMDYTIDEGSNARTWVHLEVSADAAAANPSTPLIPAGAKLFTRMPGLPASIPDDPRVYEQAAICFETIEPVGSLYRDHNELYFYTWSNQRCCLLPGATQVTLEGHHPNLTAGSILLFEEMLGPQTGNPADADPLRRHAVRLRSAVFMDPMNSPLTDPVTGTLITEIQWHEDDALPFPLCLSAQTAAGPMDRVSVARGNIVLADNGITVRDEMLEVVPSPWLFRQPDTNPAGRCDPGEPQPLFPRFSPRLQRRPLTHVAPAPDSSGSARVAMHRLPREIRPVITLTGSLQSNDARWEARRDLLNSDASAEEFVAEIDNEGGAVLRFGDDRQGRRPEPGTTFTATYRVGNGKSGNIGADTLTHIAAEIPEITGLRNPLAAQGGRDPESLEDVRQRAPVAYRTQERAVTASDYAEVAERNPAVQRAAATFRWTGSWHTVFMTLDRQGGLPVDTDFEREMQSHMERYRMAGHDLEVDAPRFVALEIELFVCVARDHFRSDIERELRSVLSSRTLLDGRRGLFHPDNFTFGQPVYLSSIYAAVHSVSGVTSVEARKFQRMGIPDAGAVESGYLEMGRLEIARLDNDRNFAERGVLTISLGGGK